ncbi:peptidase S8 [Bacillus thuringiensis]|nr:peptidase S8 [Bacillus thuringiensis]
MIIVCITFSSINIKHAKEAGAKAVIVYNNVDGEITSYLGESTASIPSFRLTKVDGEKLQAKAVQGDALKLNWTFNSMQASGEDK